MKVRDYRETFYTFTGKVSDISRQLALAGLAVVWLFKKDVAGTFTIPQQLLLPTALIIAALALDLLQYCAGSFIWRRFYRSQEEAGLSEEAEITHTLSDERPILYLFWAKVIALLFAYGLLLKFLVTAVFFR